MTEIDFSPSTSIIESIVHENFKPKVLFAELIDNALDKRATKIDLYREGNDLIIFDNGEGVADMVALLQWGRHHKTEGTVTSGRYGIGLKHAAIWLAHGMEVETRHRNRKYSLTVDWAQIIASGKWRFHMPDPVADKGPSYTKFTLGPLRQGRTVKPALIARGLSYEFSPALLNGVRIIVENTELEPVPPPPLESRIDLDQDFENHHFRLIAGIKSKGSEPQRCGFDVAYMNRLILQGDKYGTGDYSPQQFYGYVELLDDLEPWTLTTHKNHFEQHDAFFDYLYPFIEPLLEAAEQLGEEILLEDKRGEILEALSFIKKIREKRKRGSTKGTAEPADTGIPRETATNADPEQPGSVLHKRPHDVLDVKFDCYDPEKIGAVASTKTATIISLNPSFEVMKSRDTPTIVSVALSLLACHLVHNPEEKGKFGVPTFPEIERESFYLEFLNNYSNMMQRVHLHRRTPVEV